jgi:hypothetical protein
MQPPPLKSKPPHPLTVLPVPKRKGMAVILVLTPTIIGGVVGFAIVFALTWIVPVHSAVRVGVVVFLAAGGFAIGLRTLEHVLQYGARQADAAK